MLPLPSQAPPPPPVLHPQTPDSSALLISGLTIATCDASRCTSRTGGAETHPCTHSLVPGQGEGKCPGKALRTGTLRFSGGSQGGTHGVWPPECGRSLPASHWPRLEPAIERLQHRNDPLRSWGPSQNPSQNYLPGTPVVFPALDFVWCCTVYRTVSSYPVKR